MLPFFSDEVLGLPKKLRSDTNRALAVNTQEIPMRFLIRTAAQITALILL
jgi:hypothetical protein